MKKSWLHKTPGRSYWQQRSLPLAVLILGVLLDWQVAATQRPQTRQTNPETQSQQPLSELEQLLRTCQRQLNNERFELAYQTAQQALTLSRAQANLKAQARATHFAAIAAFHTNRLSEAIRYFKEASATADEAGLGQIQTNALMRAGSMLRLAGRYEDALFCFDEALRLFRERRLPVGTVLALSQIGAVYADTADYAKGRQILLEALPLAQKLNDPEPHATLLMRLLIAEKGRGDFKAALAYGHQAATLFAGHKPSLRNVELPYQMGLVYVALNQPQQAATQFEQALKLAEELRAPQLGVIAQGALAEVQLKLGQAATALESARQSVTLIRRGGGSKHHEAQFLATGAEALRAMGRPAEARESYAQALAALEQARAFSIPTEISRAGIVATRQQVFAGAISLLLSLSQTAEAFDIAEAYHARAFLDVLAENGLDTAPEANPAQQAQEERLLTQLSQIQKELWQPAVPAEQAERLQRELARAENALELFRLEQRRADPRFAGIKAPQPLPHDRIASEVLNAETALVEYVLGDQQSFAWVIFQGQVHSVALPPAQELSALVAAYHTALASKVSSQTAAPAIAKLKTQSRQLYQKLIQPLAQHLAAARQLIIVPDGALAHLPFETLAAAPKRGASTQYLLERFAISYAPSASALAALRALKQNNSATAQGLIAFGDPVYSKEETGNSNERGYDFRQLPYTRHEVNEISALFPAAERRIFLGQDADEAAVKAEPLKQYRYVHFATHALVDEERPARSGIMLSAPMSRSTKEDGALQMSEIMRLKLNADLVTLSACRTGLGQLLKGEGIIGLTRAFLYAGSESVVVSLWNVNDIATASLMKAFYKRLQQGLSKDEALRQAKLELLRGQQQAWRHPYYWAPFVLVGEPH